MEKAEKIENNSQKSARLPKKEKIYSANEVCNIIKTCSKNGVTNIKISGIEVNFINQGTDLPKAGMQWSTPKKVSTKKTEPLKPLELNEQDLEEIRQLEMAQQAIDDPVGYEQELIDSFIHGEVNEETRHRETE